jgi:hypothetical protein
MNVVAEMISRRCFLEGGAGLACMLASARRRPQRDIDREDHQLNKAGMAEESRKLQSILALYGAEFGGSPHERERF